MEPDGSVSIHCLNVMGTEWLPTSCAKNLMTWTAPSCSFDQWTSSNVAIPAKALVKVGTPCDQVCASASSLSLACHRPGGAAQGPRTRSSVCTRSSSDGSKPRPCCRQPILLPCCSGRCSAECEQYRHAACHAVCRDGTGEELWKWIDAHQTELGGRVGICEHRRWPHGARAQPRPPHHDRGKWA